MPGRAATCAWPCGSGVGSAVALVALALDEPEQVGQRAAGLVRGSAGRAPRGRSMRSTRKLQKPSRTRTRRPASRPRSGRNPAAARGALLRQPFRSRRCGTIAALLGRDAQYPRRSARGRVQPDRRRGTPQALGRHRARAGSTTRIFDSAPSACAASAHVEPRLREAPPRPPAQASSVVNIVQRQVEAGAHAVTRPPRPRSGTPCARRVGPSSPVDGALRRFQPLGQEARGGSAAARGSTGRSGTGVRRGASGDHATRGHAGRRGCPRCR